MAERLVRRAVEAFMAQDLDGLLAVADPHIELRSLLTEGVTTLEVKSGYGLDYEAERRMLLAARALEARLPVRVVKSLLAMHAVPRD